MALLVPVLLSSFLSAFAVATTGDYLLMPRSELMSLPTSGSAWNYLNNIANGSWGTINLMNQDSQANTMALAGALVYARTGNTAMRTKVRNAIMTMVPTFDPGANSGLAVGRQMAAWVMAADFIDLASMDPAADTAFRAHVLLMLTASRIGTHSQWGVNLRVTHNDSPNNHGGWAGASRIISDLYLGNQATDLAAAANTTRGFLGDRSYWSQFRDQKGNADSTIASWMCNPNRLTGATPVNPPCVKNGINVDGAVVADISRQDVSLTWPPTSTGEGYTSEVIAGMLLQVELLHRNGYPTIYDFQSKALKRMADVLTRIDAAGGDGWNRGSVQTHMSWLLNRRYGTTYPTVPAQMGRSLGYTDWLYSGGTVAPTPTPTASPTPTPTASPTPTPTASPTPAPTASPTPAPTASPTPEPTASPTTSTISLRSTYSATVVSTSIVLNRPTGTVVGDVLVAVIDMRGNKKIKITPPSGWTFVRLDAYGNSLTKAIYYRAVASTEPTSYRFAFSKSQTVNGIVLTFDGVNTKNPVAASSGTATANSASIQAPGASAPPGGAYLVGLFGTATDTTLEPPAGMTERVDITQLSARYYLTSEVATQTVGSGATGTKIATATKASNNIGQLLLLMPK